MEFKTKGYSRVEYAIIWGIRTASFPLLFFLITDYEKVPHYFFFLPLAIFIVQTFADSRNSLAIAFIAGEIETKTLDFKFSPNYSMPRISCNGSKIPGSRQTSGFGRNQTYIYQIGYGEVQTITINKVRTSLRDFYSGKYSFQILINGEALKKVNLLFVKS